MPSGVVTFGDHPPERDHRHLAGAAADVHDHVAGPPRGQRSPAAAWAWRPPWGPWSLRAPNRTLTPESSGAQARSALIATRPRSSPRARQTRSSRGPGQGAGEALPRRAARGPGAVVSAPSAWVAAERWAALLARAVERLRPASPRLDVGQVGRRRSGAPERRPARTATGAARAPLAGRGDLSADRADPTPARPGGVAARLRGVP
jgi:hypothetical protein